MSSSLDPLKAVLNSADSLPFLFVGSGVSRRYLNHEDWRGLLTWAASLTDEPFQYYSSRVEGDLPQVASDVAAAFHEKWWHDDDYEESRAEWAAEVRSLADPLKIEIARKLLVAGRTTDPALVEELEVLGSCHVDGIVTTNYDRLLEEIFPEYAVFVGQEDLLLSRSYQLGEIYKIHGSLSSPSSMVLTAEDYAKFDEASPYLVSKLMSVFVEHPIVFLGYSLTDRNIRTILTSLLKCLDRERLEHFKQRFIWVEWSPDDGASSMGDHVIDLGEGRLLPVVRVRSPSYKPVFDILGGLERRLPIGLLRRVQESVVEIVNSADPDRRIAVVGLEDVTDFRAIDVVVGVGQTPAESERHARSLLGKGYLGLSRRDLILDVLEEDPGQLDAERVLQVTLPDLLRKNASTWIPVHTFVSRAGLRLEDVPEVVQAAAQRTPASNYSRLSGLSADTIGKYLESDGPTRTLHGVLWIADEIDDRDLRKVLADLAGQIDWADANLVTAYAKATFLCSKLRFEREESERYARTADTSDAGIRAWAKASGVPVSGRGRVSRSVREQFEAARAAAGN